MLEAYLISVATKSTILLAAGAILLRCLRGHNERSRHLVCLAALSAAAAVPWAALWAPRWSLAIAVPAGMSAGSVQGGAAIAFVSWAALLAWGWALGAAGMMVRAAGGWFLLWRARLRSAPFRRVEGAEVRTAEVGTPLTCGVLRPLILLPESARDWDEERLRAVLLHESAHVHRRDCLAKYVAQISRALLWWNPLAWMLADALHCEQELACDSAVLAAGVAPQDYAAVLLASARECSASLLLGCAMIGGKMTGSSALRTRVERLFAGRLESSGATRRIAIAIPLLLILMTGVSFAEKIYKLGPGIVPPKVLVKNEPAYTEEARAAKIQGPVVLALVVGVDQAVHDIRVTQSLDPGLDANAVACIRTWRFQPATKDGKPVAVRALVQVNFRLK
jgi:TonB family protein